MTTQFQVSDPPDLPSPPFVSVEGIPNLRDIGGYAKPSGSVRLGRIYRSADPSRVSPSGLSTLSSLGIERVFDLRSSPEIKRVGREWGGLEHEDGAGPFGSEGGPDGGKIVRKWTPVFTDTDYSPEAVALRFKSYTRVGSEGFVHAYSEIMGHGGTAYREILKFVAQGEGACLVHCTAGKDRTGVLVAVILLLLGVDRRVVAREYSLTDLGLAALKPVYKERLLQTDALKGDEEGVERMISSREENMRDTITMMDEKYGGAEGYVKKVVGLTQDDIEAIRRNLSSNEKPIL
ncbi:hypothetical protein ANO11243_022210 [Dothideomycetidae sp. 11243]|nr:hypothetical protein ANO11243_022210 [fungal sp. No.11243]